MQDPLDRNMGLCNHVHKISRKGCNMKTPAQFCRFFLPALVMALCAPLSNAAESNGPWYADSLVGMEVGPTGAQFGADQSDTPYASKFSGKDIVDAQIATGSQYLVIWGKDSEYAYYNSKVAPKCPGMGERDVVQESLDAAKPHKLPVIVYCVVQGNGYPLRDHPEYKMAGSDGKPIDRICLNSGYLDHAVQVLDELMDYDIDGFHIDMLDQGFGPPYGCWCDNCKRLFEAEHGQPMPQGVTWDGGWDKMMNFRFNTSLRFEKALYDHVKKRNPKLAVDFNYHGNPPFSWEVGQLPVMHAHVGDFVTGESGVWGFGALNSSLEALFLRATDPEGIFQVVMQRGVQMYHDQTTRPLNDMRWEMFTLLAQGSVVTIVDKTAHDGSLDPVAYDRFGKIFKEVRAKAPHFGRNHKPVKSVGLYYSSRSRDWYGRETPRKYQEAFLGAHKAMILEHIPVSFLLDENTTPELLRTFPVVYLPGAAILSEKEAAMFREYVEQGGNLILTGFTGLFDAMGAPLANSILAELIGADLVERLDSIDNHVALDGSVPEAMKRDITADWPFLVRGPAAVFKPTAAQPAGLLHKPVRTVRQIQGLEGTEMPNSAGAVAGPAMLVNKLGRGTVLAFACSPDAALAGEYGMTEDRLLLRNAVAMLHPAPPVRVDAPTFVESVVTEGPEPDTMRVHLIGYVSPPACLPKNRPHIFPQMIEDKPMYRAAVTLDRLVKSAEVCNDDTEMRIDGSTVHLVVNDIHEVLVLKK